MRPAFLPEVSDFEQRFIPEPNTGCWIWLNHIHPVNGYGQFCKKIDGHQYAYRAHRIAWELYKSKIPEDKVIDHKCRVRHCVNPAHMEVVTQRENVYRGIGKAAEYHRQTHCLHGHLLSDDNVYKYNGRYGVTRQCRTCNTDRERKRDRIARGEYTRAWRQRKKEKANEPSFQ